MKAVSANARDIGRHDMGLATHLQQVRTNRLTFVFWVFNPLDFILEYTDICKYESAAAGNHAQWQIGINCINRGTPVIPEQ